MRGLGTLAILLLSISIISFSFTGIASAQSNVPPVSVETDFPAYGETGVITVSGHVKENILSEFKMPVTIKVQKEDGSLVGLDQVMLDREGDFTTSISHGGAMTSAGDYTITENYKKGVLLFLKTFFLVIFSKILERNRAPIFLKTFF